MGKDFHGITRYLRQSQLLTGCCKYSTTTSSKAYSGTLLLPKTEFRLRPDPSIREEPFRQRTADDLYKWQWDNLQGPVFVLHDGPPYANGNLHMGHALNKILKDIINRFHVLCGHRVHYVPGWDCHGLPIENKALKELRVSHRTLPPSQIREIARQTATREISIQKAEFRKLGIMADWDSDHRTYRTMVRSGLIYRQYRPVYYSPSSRSALAEAELVYVDDHLSRSVYVSYECVFDTFSPGLRNILQPHITGTRKVNLLIWTTTPWTLPTNMAIAINSNMEYVLVKGALRGDIFILGKDLLPNLQKIFDQEMIILHTCQGSELLSIRYYALFQCLDSPYQHLPIIHSPHVTSTSGTGLVHCAPAHGNEDYQIFPNNTIFGPAEERDLLCLVGPDGTFSEQAIAEAERLWLDSDIGERLVGKPVLKDGTAEVIEILRASQNLLHEHQFRHRYPYDWKTNTPIIVTATSQWFADLSMIKDDALKALETVQFVPGISRMRLESFVRDRSEWCISRQRPWGVPIPALFNETTRETILTEESLEFIISVLDKKGIEYWWNGPIEDFISPELKAIYPHSSWERGNDTMDVWFDSGTSWTLLTNSGHEETNLAKQETIADVCLEGSDQHRGWFQSLLLTAVGASKSLNNEASENLNPTLRPYNCLITHGFILDERGKKMSKSLGNVISPMTIINGGKDPKAQPPYGADVLRLWAATIDYTRDTLLGPKVLQQTEESLRKIRNSARFLLGNLSQGFKPITEKPSSLNLADRYVMHELYHLERTSKEAYKDFHFSQVAVSLDRFAKVTLSSLYLDITKDILYADSPNSPSRQSILWVMNEVNTLILVLETMTMIMAPILPHLSEEISHYARLQNDGSDSEVRSVFTKGWKSVDDSWNNAGVADAMGSLLRVRDAVLGLLERARGDKLIKSSLEAYVDIIIPDGSVNETVDLLSSQESFLKTLFIVSDAQVVDEGSLGTDAYEWSISETFDIPGNVSIIQAYIHSLREI
ncbi:hypothetical protein Clacol_009362 [Clathrus columnatus]|uniref:isoleucine--tRNA ligase n=1 Tax=Clathrus columnatus TaxID=1419009 RepID=A0AAV5AMX6_9AGAM|nr:hypothetical protein Clacol_009362 [Clathrus columnatus]